MLISRNDILKGVVPYYLSDDILNDGLHVRFENEPAEDFTGVTKDMFSSVWKTIREKFMTGENYSRINLVPGNLCSVNEYKAFGRILEHGFKLANFRFYTVRSSITNPTPSSSLSRTTNAPGNFLSLWCTLSNFPS